MNRTAKPILHRVMFAALLLILGNSLLASPPTGRIVFFGDSITEQRVYTRYLMNYITLRYPGANCTFRNAGWGGDTVQGGLARIQRDVISLDPDLVTVCFGMNDGQYKPFDQTVYDNYVAGLTSIVRALKTAGVSVVVLTPGCVDYDTAPNLSPFYNDTLNRLAQGAIQVATAEQVPYYDIHTLMVDVQTRGKAANPSFTMIPDGIHPSSMGAAVMAYGLIKAMGLGADQPATLELNATTRTIIPSKCTVTNISWGTDAISFIRTDDSLPMWLDMYASPVLPYLPFSSELNNYTFKVTGLKSGNWQLMVEGILTGIFTSEQLAEGVNLSERLGGWARVATVVDYLAQQQDHVYYTKWRTLGQLWLPQGVEVQFSDTMASIEALAAAWDAVRIATPLKDHTWYWSLTYVP